MIYFMYACVALGVFIELASKTRYNDMGLVNKLLLSVLWPVVLGIALVVVDEALVKHSEEEK